MIGTPLDGGTGGRLGELPDIVEFGESQRKTNENLVSQNDLLYVVRREKLNPVFIVRRKWKG